MHASSPRGRADELPSYPAPQDQEGQRSLSLLLRAMIAAAKADGGIDVAESQRILAQIERLELGTQAKAFLPQEYAKPLNLDGLLADVDSPEHAVEVYAASLLVIGGEGNPAEQVYLRELAQRLALEPALVQAVHQEVAAAR